MDATQEATYWTDENGVITRMSTCLHWMPHKNLLQQQARAFIHRRDNFTCQKCGGSETPLPDYRGEAAVGFLQTDHVIPLSRGGGHHPDNLQVLCATCNTQKHVYEV